MKKTVLPLVLFFLAVTVSSGQSKDEQEIRRLETLWTQLLDRSDTTALLKIWAVNYTVNNPDGKIATPGDIVALIRKGHVFPKVERMIERITFTSDIAVVMGKEVEKSRKPGATEETVTNRRFTDVWIRSGSGWQLIARQSTKIVQ